MKTLGEKVIRAPCPASRRRAAARNRSSVDACTSSRGSGLTSRTLGAGSGASRPNRAGCDPWTTGIVIRAAPRRPRARGSSPPGPRRRRVGTRAAGVARADPRERRLLLRSGDGHDDPTSGSQGRERQRESRMGMHVVTGRDHPPINDIEARSAREQRRRVPVGAESEVDQPQGPTRHGAVPRRRQRRRRDRHPRPAIEWTAPVVTRSSQTRRAVPSLESGSPIGTHRSSPNQNSVPDQSTARIAAFS